MARIGRGSRGLLSIDQKEIDQKEQPSCGVSIVRTIKERRHAFISMTAEPASYHFPGSSLIRNLPYPPQAQESDPERGNGQLEAGLLVLADLAAVFLPVVFFVFFSIPILAEAAFPPDFFALVFLLGEAVLSAVSFFAVDLLAEAEGFFSVFFSAFFLVFFSVFFSVGSSAAFLDAFFTGFVVAVFSCLAEAVTEAVAFFTGFMIGAAVLLPAFSAGSSAAAFLMGAFLLVAGFFTVADFLVVAISTSR
jgi:hypothetical protein